jgi:hypothetical protein
MSKDEERYKFIRENFNRLIVSTMVAEGELQVSCIEIQNNFSQVSPESVDDAIDEAIECCINET